MDITRIRTKADYDEAYRLSVEDPEGFWAAQADTSRGARSGTPCWNGTSRHPK
jgi:hypothetical protein